MMKPLKVFALFCFAYAAIWAGMILSFDFKLWDESNLAGIAVLSLSLGGICFLPPIAFAVAFQQQTKIARFRYLSLTATLSGLVFVSTFLLDHLDGGLRIYAEFLYMLFGASAGFFLSFISIVGGCLVEDQKRATRLQGFATLAFLVVALLAVVAGYADFGDEVENALIPSMGACTFAITGFLTAMIIGTKPKSSHVDELKK